MARRTPPTLVIPSTTRYLGAVRRFVEAHARTAGFSREAIEQLKLAVDEACTNVIAHAYAGDEHGQVELGVTVDEDAFTVVIRDQGRAFDEHAYTAPSLRKSINRRRGGGYGVFIMRHLMDDVSYDKEGEINVVRLKKLIPQAARQDSSANGVQ